MDAHLQVFDLLRWEFVVRGGQRGLDRAGTGEHASSPHRGPGAQRRLNTLIGPVDLVGVR
ncbi:hypothetical protein QP028_08700 [Corynebacterium suedekumii]|nr:hypothetical protein QP028_08700 [Corynebacterium suedekumii]